MILDLLAQVGRQIILEEYPPLAVVKSRASIYEWIATIFSKKRHKQIHARMVK
ncbi:MAG: hypothetical protein ACYCY5_02960 [Sulfuricella sp.]